MLVVLEVGLLVVVDVIVGLDVVELGVVEGVARVVVT